jgi:hypothetical protein
MNNIPNLLKNLMQAHIDEAKAIVELAKDYNAQNSQEYLDWQDTLNQISIA